MSYQLCILARVKTFLLRQFYIKGTSGKKVDGLSESDYQQFLTCTRMTEIFGVLNELRFYRGTGKNPRPFIDFETAAKLVEEINKKLTSIQLDATYLDTLFETKSTDEYDVYVIGSLTELIDNFKRFEKRKKDIKKEKHGVRKANKRARAKQNIHERALATTAKLNKIKHQLDKSKKFVALDFEAYEWNQKKVTEIGFSVFEDEEFKHYHYIIKENIKYRNGKHVPDNKFNYNFGESEILPLKVAFNKLNEVLESADYLIGHGVNNEIKWLKRNDVELHTKLKTIDTGTLAGGFMKEGRRVSLTKILEFLDIEFERLHNAGNDSFYTMKALWHMVMRATA